MPQPSQFPLPPGKADTSAARLGSLVKGQHPRQQLMLDQDVQGVLIGRVVRYWFLCLASTVLAAWVWSAWSEPQAMSPLAMLRHLTPALVGSLFVLPLAIADMLRMSNRFVGPVFRLRNAMKCIVLGDDIEPLRPRSGDYWNDLIERFNQLHRELTGRSHR